MKNISTGTSHLIVTEDTNNVITITLNNPRYLNALSEELSPYLRKILKKINKDSNCKLLIIKGAVDSLVVVVVVVVVVAAVVVRST